MKQIALRYPEAPVQLKSLKTEQLDLIKLRKGYSSQSEERRGLLLFPLFEALSRYCELEKQQALLEKRPGSLRLNLFLDKRLPFQSVAEILYTAAQSGYAEFYLALGDLKHPRGVALQLPQITPLTTALKGPSHLSLTLRLLWSKEGLMAYGDLRRGQEALQKLHSKQVRVHEQSLLSKLQSSPR